MWANWLKVILQVIGSGLILQSYVLSSIVYVCDKLVLVSFHSRLDLEGNPLDTAGASKLAELMVKHRYYGRRHFSLSWSTIFRCLQISTKPCRVESERMSNFWCRSQGSSRGATGEAKYPIAKSEVMATAPDNGGFCFALGLSPARTRLGQLAWQK